MRGAFAGLLLIYSTIYYSATGYVMQESSMCSFGDDKQGNITFYYFITFNRQRVVEYDEEDDKFYPCYDCIPEVYNVAAAVITQFNNISYMAKYVKNEKKRCEANAKAFWDSTVERRVKPSMEVFSPVKVNVDSLPVLICFVWGFYPQDIIITWIKNNEAVIRNYTEGVRVGDWTYQIMAKIDLRGSLPEDNYTCAVEHISLDEAMMTTWQAGLTSSEIIKISVSTAVFGVGLILLIIGVVCWKNTKKSGYIIIPGNSDDN
ncbi:HLA class II histocompatibility antigen, DM beta chain [Pseudophryne corroboree]|uniref:HLA class II histocompatibility antigen, DM beta chain n=1 Tax=Pseudophryne corroboree TaxID=495146 RepID=UPI003081AAC6